MSLKISSKKGESNVEIGNWKHIFLQSESRWKPLLWQHTQKNNTETKFEGESLKRFDWVSTCEEAGWDRRKAGARRSQEFCDSVELLGVVFLFAVLKEGRNYVGGVNIANG